MGCRLTVASKYQVQFAPGGFFNWMIEEINCYIGDLYEKLELDKEYGPIWYNTDSISYADELEIDKIAFREMFNHLRKMDTNDVLIKSDDGDIIVREMFQFMDFVLENTDPYNDYVRLYWL